MYTSSIKRQIRRFHVVVVQWTSKKCTKKRDARAELLFLSLNPFFIFEVVVVVVVVAASSPAWGPPPSCKQALMQVARLRVGVYLTIIPRARMGSESIAHEAEGRMGY